MIPLFIYRNKHPANLVCLAIFVSNSLNILMCYLLLIMAIQSCIHAVHAQVLASCTHLYISLSTLQTFCLSVSVGTACSVFAPEIVLEAVVLTAAIVGGLAAYSFHATRKGKDFT